MRRCCSAAWLGRTCSSCGRSWSAEAERHDDHPRAALREDETRRAASRTCSARLPLAAATRIATGSPRETRCSSRRCCGCSWTRASSSEGGGWVADGDLGELDVPPTIQALLRARLDRLAPRGASADPAGSVAGQVFWWGAVAELRPLTTDPAVGGSLQRSSGKELIEHERSDFVEDDAFRFRHI